MGAMTEKSGSMRRVEWGNGEGKQGSSNLGVDARAEEKTGMVAGEIRHYLSLVGKGNVERREGLEGRGMGGNVECEERSDECGGRMR